MAYKSHLKEIKRLSVKASVLENKYEDFRELLGYYQEQNKQDDYLWLSMAIEAKAIESNEFDLDSPYQAARLLLYKTLLLDRMGKLIVTEETLAKFLSNIIPTEFDLNINKAGNMLFTSGGMSYMQDPLLEDGRKAAGFRHGDERILRLKPPRNDATALAAVCA